MWISVSDSTTSHRAVEMTRCLIRSPVKAKVSPPLWKMRWRPQMLREWQPQERIKTRRRLLASLEFNLTSPGGQKLIWSALLCEVPLGRALSGCAKNFFGVYANSVKTSHCPITCPPPPCMIKMVISQLLIKIEHWCLVHTKGLWKHFQDFIIWLLW